LVSHQNRFSINFKNNIWGNTLIYFVIGFAVLFVLMLIVGINDPTGETSMKGWCYQYLVIALGFDALAIFSLIYQNALLTELLLGVASGSATVLGIHVAHHIKEENQGKGHEH
jgi:Na+-driven multidrug efflux pump